MQDCPLVAERFYVLLFDKYGRSLGLDWVGGALVDDGETAPSLQITRLDINLANLGVRWLSS